MSFTYTSEQSVECVDVLGSDLTVVNAARVSFGSTHAAMTAGDRKLVSYLAQHKHYSPFRHCMLQFRIRMPEFVARQFYKHVVGIECTSTHPTKDHAWNEISGRYKPYTEMYRPVEWNRQHSSAKQCSAERLDDETHERVARMYEGTIDQAMRTYHSMLEAGVSREQARVVLPLTIMTEVVWTASLQAVANFVELRRANDSQREIRDLADRIHEVALERFPVAYTALNEN